MSTAACAQTFVTFLESQYESKGAPDEWLQKFINAVDQEFGKNEDKNHEFFHASITKPTAQNMVIVPNSAQASERASSESPSCSSHTGLRSMACCFVFWFGGQRATTTTARSVSTKRDWSKFGVYLDSKVSERTDSGVAIRFLHPKYVQLMDAHVIGPMLDAFEDFVGDESEKSKGVTCSDAIRRLRTPVVGMDTFSTTSIPALQDLHQPKPPRPNHTSAVNAAPLPEKCRHTALTPPLTELFVASLVSTDVRVKYHEITLCETDQDNQEVLRVGNTLCPPLRRADDQQFTMVVDFASGHNNSGVDSQSLVPVQVKLGATFVPQGHLMFLFQGNTLPESLHSAQTMIAAIEHALPGSDKYHFKGQDEFQFIAGGVYGKRTTQGLRNVVGAWAHRHGVAEHLFVTMNPNDMAGVMRSVAYPGQFILAIDMSVSAQSPHMANRSRLEFARVVAMLKRTHIVEQLALSLFVFVPIVSVQVQQVNSYADALKLNKSSESKGAYTLHTRYPRDVVRNVLHGQKPFYYNRAGTQTDAQTPQKGPDNRNIGSRDAMEAFNPQPRLKKGPKMDLSDITIHPFRATLWNDLVNTTSLRTRTHQQQNRLFEIVLDTYNEVRAKQSARFERALASQPSSIMHAQKKPTATGARARFVMMVIHAIDFVADMSVRVADRDVDHFDVDSTY